MQNKFAQLLLAQIIIFNAMEQSFKVLADPSNLGRSIESVTKQCYAPFEEGRARLIKIGVDLDNLNGLQVMIDTILNDTAPGGMMGFKMATCMQEAMKKMEEKNNGKEKKE